MSYMTVVWVILLVKSVGGTCENYFSIKNTQLIIDYAKMKNIRHVVILTENVKRGKKKISFLGEEIFKVDLENLTPNILLEYTLYFSSVLID